MRPVFALLVLASWVAGAAPAGAGSTVALTVHDFEFSPSTLTVPVGTTVQITNTGSYAHTWTSDPGDTQQWDAGQIDPGSSFSVTFDHAGQFGFHCNFHPYMTGMIVVVSATPSTTAVPPTVTTPATTSAPTVPVVTSPTSAPAASSGAQIGPSTPTSAAAAPGAVLAHTGASNANALLAAAATLTLLGIALVASAGRRRRRVE